MHAPCLPLKLLALHIYLFPACGDVTFVWKQPWNDLYVDKTRFVNYIKYRMKTALVSMLVNFSFLFMCFFLVFFFKPRANGCNIVGCYMLRPFAHPVACCWTLLRVVAQSLKPVKLFGQQLPAFLLFRDRRSVPQQCWIRLHNSSNIVGATHAHYASFTETYGLYPSYHALQVPTLLGAVASVCTPLPTRAQQIPTLLAKQCWKLLRAFARSLIIAPDQAFQTTFSMHF